MKFIYKFLVAGGKIVFIYSILIVISISLISVSIKGKVNYGDRCNIIINQDIITKHVYPNVNLVSDYIGCNTCYLEYQSQLDERSNLLFLASLSKLLSDNHLVMDLHIIINCSEYQMIATIVNYNISYVKSNI